MANTIYDHNKTEDENVRALLAITGVPTERASEIKIVYEGLDPETKRVNLTASVTDPEHPFAVKYNNMEQKFSLSPVRPIPHAQVLSLSNSEVGTEIDPNTQLPDIYIVALSESFYHGDRSVTELDKFLLQTHIERHGTAEGYIPLANTAKVDIANINEYPDFYSLDLPLVPSDDSHVFTGKTLLSLELIPDFTPVHENLIGKAGLYSPYFEDFSKQFKPFTYFNGDTKFCNVDIIHMTALDTQMPACAGIMLTANPFYSEATESSNNKIGNDLLAKQGYRDINTANPKTSEYVENTGAVNDNNFRFVNGLLHYAYDMQDIPHENPDNSAMGARPVLGKASFSVFSTELFHNMMYIRFGQQYDEYGAYPNADSEGLGGIDNMSVKNLNERFSYDSILMANVAMSNVQPTYSFTEVPLDEPIPGMTSVLHYDMSDKSKLLDVTNPDLYNMVPPAEFPFVSLENKKEYIAAIGDFVLAQVGTSSYIPKITTKTYVEQEERIDTDGNFVNSTFMRVLVLVENKFEGMGGAMEFVREFHEEALTGYFGYEFILNGSEDLFIPQPEYQLNGFMEIDAPI